MKILSLFDGMSCGAIAFTKLGIPIDRYVAYEIDKYAVKVASHNFPFIEQRGDVFHADFAEFEGFDFVIGGSPCTYWSIAQKNNRETEASGLGWELFSQYVRALHEAKPKYFLYENNKSMSKEIRASIDKTFGFEAVGINSALVSAQNRQRLYWVGIRQADGTYRKADVEQPEDRGVLLRYVLDNAVAWREKSYCIDANYYKSGNLTSFTKQSGTRFMAAEPVNVTTDGKAQTLRSTCYKDGIRNMVGNNVDRKTCVAEPVAVDLQVVGRKKNADGVYERSWEARTDGKSSNLTSVESRRMVAEPVCVAQRVRYAESGEIIQHYEPGEDGKTQPIYEVRNGLITIKDKQYPIKLADGYYIIRKLTVSECMRLQTVPEWYDMSVISNSQAYKCLGNGWTVDVITHLIQSVQIENAPTEVAASSEG